MQQGIDTFLKSANAYQHLRIAVVSNHVSFTSNGIPVTVALQDAGFPVVAIFSPEHGIAAQAADGQMIPSVKDPLTGLPVISLYGEKLMPTASDVADIDLIVFDLPNIGCRFYTYLWTLSYIMEACTVYQKRLIILDRINPLGKHLNQAEGPMLDELHCSSFLGRWSIPLRFQLTFGELSLYWKKVKNFNISLEVIPVQNWNRNDHRRADCFFVPASPSMPHYKTALLYPGTGLMEAYNLSEGRGTALPFQLLGAPWINSITLSAALNALKIPGILFYPFEFLPAWGRYALQQCKGVYMEVTDEQHFKPVYTGVMILSVINDLYPQHLKEAEYPTAAHPAGKKHLEKLSGMIGLHKIIQDTPNHLKQVLPSLLNVDPWLLEVEPFLLY